MKLSISSEDKILFDGFFEESLEYLDSIEEKILLLETEFSIDLVNNIFRAIHTRGFSHKKSGCWSTPSECKVMNSKQYILD